MNELQIFSSEQFGQVRTLEENEQVMFCGSDVAKALGYTNPNKAINDHCRAITKRSTPISGKIQEINFISEGDVYRLIVQSKLPTAEKFERWVFDEVLPSIHKHGVYATTKTIERIMDDPDFMIRTFTALKEEREKRMVLEQRVAEYEPKIEYVDTILQSKDVVATSQIAADYGLSARRLNQILHEERIQRNVGGQWILYANHMNFGYTKSETIHFKHSDGRKDTKMQTKWTQKGRIMIHNILKSRGIQANMDRDHIKNAKEPAPRQKPRDGK